MKKRGPRLADLASISGVSTATVWKVLAGDKNVKEETRQKIARVVESLSDTPWQAGASGEGNQVESLGVVAFRRHGDPLLSDPFYVGLLEGVEAESLERNCSLSVFSFPLDGPGGPRVRQALEALADKPVDGLVLLGSLPAEFLPGLQPLGLPFVVVDHFSPSVGAPYFLIDNVEGALLAVRHLAMLGHAAIGMVCGPLEHHRFFMRHEGFLSAMRGLKIEPGLVLVDPHESDPSTDWMLPIVEKGIRPGAVFCADDRYAFRLLKLAREKGLECPRDLSVVGFGDLPAASASQPGLTTVRADPGALGLRAARKLMDLVGRPEAAPETYRAPVELVPRASTARME